MVDLNEEFEEEEIESGEKEVLVRLKPEEAKRLRTFLNRKSSGIQRPHIMREGNRIIIDTGLDEHCTFNKGLPNEIHALRIYQRAMKFDVDELGQRINIVPAVSIIERIEGGFCYMDGKVVSRREDLDIIPKTHRDAAYTWFDKKYGKESVPSNGGNRTSNEEEELSLKDRVILGVSKGISGKLLAEKLKCSEGSISIYKAKAIKEKILDKKGKLTPLGLEKFGQIRLNL
jgi:hypothetical protein